MGNDNEIRFQKMKPRLDEWAAHGQTLLGFGTVKISPGLCELDKNRPCVVCLNC